MVDICNECYSIEQGTRILSEKELKARGYEPGEEVAVCSCCETEASECMRYVDEDAGKDR